MSKSRASPQGGPPDKGSFPLDHFQECDEEGEDYRRCLNEACGVAKLCKDESKKYLICRMDKGLMSRLNMRELGFVEESTYEYEQKSKKEIIKKVQNIMKESRERVFKEYADKRK